MSIFDGDGRSYIRPDRDSSVGLPCKVSLCTARKFLRDFEERRLYYSATGGMLWFHELYCKEKGYRYTITGNNEIGWTITAYS